MNEKKVKVDPYMRFQLEEHLEKSEVIYFRKSKQIEGSDDKE